MSKLNKSGTPKVSIHMINYNHAAYLNEAIEGALAQDYLNFEIVIADDASTDGSAEIIAEYAKRHPDKIIPVMNKQNLGITANSNAGLRACSGDLISFTDSDDVLLAGKISAQVDWFQQHPKGVLCGHQAEVFYEDESRPPHPLSRMLKGSGADTLIRNIPFGKTTIMVRADRIPPHGFDEQLKVVSDLLMWVDVVDLDGEFGYVSGTFARYRRHESNVTRDPFANLDEVARYFEILYERFPSLNKSICRAVTRRLYYDVGVALVHAGRKSEARVKLWRGMQREPTFAKLWIRLLQTML